MPLTPSHAWEILSDIRRIAHSIPGVKLTDVLDERTYKGTISVALGPAALNFASSVKLEEIDPIKHTARLQAQGTDAEGRGDVHGTLSFRLVPSNGGSRVQVHTDLVLSGAAAQFGKDVKWSKRPPVGSCGRPLQAARPNPWCSTQALTSSISTWS